MNSSRIARDAAPDHAVLRAPHPAEQGYGRDREASPALPWLRTVGLVLSFSILIAAQIILCCLAAALIGSLLVGSGILTLEQLVQPQSIISAVALGSIVIGTFAALSVNVTLTKPMRRMSAAVSELARGNFDFRLAEQGRFCLREVREFTKSFNAAASELASTELMRKEFVSDFSHEFRTPISSLCGFAELLRAGDLTQEEQDEYLDIIIDEARRLSGLSERILTLTRIEHTQILPDTETVNIAEQLRRAAVLLEPKWSRRGVSVNISADECEVEGNADYLMQLWRNVLDNAVKFSPDGGTVSVALYGGRQGEDGSGRDAREAVCWISDEGPGMDARTRAHVFDRFYQGDASHATEGNGIGLSVCKRVVELHGGSIDVQSEPGQGTVFEIRLPVVQPASAHPSGRAR